MVSGRQRHDRERGRDMVWGGGLMVSRRQGHDRERIRDMVGGEA